ncbi:MAG: glycosyltransferase family 1 protein [Clostridiales bacterium]|nr:glycosyltransferase family 1 protein [Clostridiales bacterium]
MIRILHIVSSLGTGSGVMSVLMSYHRCIDRSQIQFDYLSFRPTEQTYEEEIKTLGGRVYHFCRPSFSRSFREKADAFFKEHGQEYPIVHCHPIYASALFGPSARRGGVAHVVQHSHTTKLSENPLSALRNFAVLLLFGRRATDLAACSEAAKRIFFWADPKKVYLMRNAIDAKKFRFSPQARTRIRAMLSIADDAPVLIHIGRFSKEKNHPFLLQLFQEVHSKKPDARLILVGDGEEMGHVRALTEKAGLTGAVIFAGRQACVADYLSAADCFVLPSLFEGLGIVLVEAQANGLPCYASENVPKEAAATALVTFLPLKNGPLYWSDKILNSLPPELSERMQTEIADRFAIDAAAADLTAYYLNLLQ